MSELPEGWTITRLGDIATEVRNGIATRPDDRGVLPILRISAVRPMSLDTADIRFLAGTPQEWASYQIREDDLMFTRYNGNSQLVGACARVIVTPDTPIVYPDKLIRVRLRDQEVVPAFVEKAVNVGASRAFINERLKSSAGQVGIAGGDLKEVPIPIPPLAEQRRIVAKIDALTSRSRRAKEALDAIPVLLDRFRQSVLASAFRGDLTSAWREKNPDVEPAEELLKRIRVERRQRWEEAELAKMRAKDKVPGDDRWKEKYEEPESVDDTELPKLPVGWRWSNAAEVVREDIAYGVVQPGPQVNDGVPFIRAMDMEDGMILEQQLGRIGHDIANEYERTRLVPGDVLLGIIRAAKVAVVSESLAGGNIVRGIARIAPATGIVSEFLAGWLRSPFAQDLLSAKNRGMDMPVINLSDVRRLPVPVAPTSEQHSIAVALSRYEQIVHKARASVAGANSRLFTLDQAILAKAFRGDLVTQDPTDEPAAVLLERLRAERAQPPASNGAPIKKRRKS